jgi:hypothetical protein
MHRVVDKLAAHFGAMPHPGRRTSVADASRTIGCRSDCHDAGRIARRPKSGQDGRSMSASNDSVHRECCATCYGSGEIVTEQGSLVCPDCLGQGLPPARGGAMEWRLREIERAHRATAHGCEADVRWLILELRRSREALVRIFTRCQDASDPLARELAFAANEVLGLYATKAEP